MGKIKKLCELTKEEIEEICSINKQNDCCSSCPLRIDKYFKCMRTSGEDGTKYYNDLKKRCKEIKKLVTNMETKVVNVEPVHKIHRLKIKWEYMDDIDNGKKSFELRKNDRNFKENDIIHFIDTNGNKFVDFTRVYYVITYVLKDVEQYGLDKDYCILGIREAFDNELEEIIENEKYFN